jgi:YidC/Oxa1 family membrane protein insertase
MQWTLEHIHVYTGLPWFASIAVTALVVRLALFKPSLTAAEQSAKLTELRKNPRFLEVQKTMMEALRDPDRRMEGMMLRREFGAMRQKAGVKIWKTLVPLLQLPIGLGMFRLLRGMATLPVPGMENGGFLWFTDLTIPDPLFVLPIASAGIMWWIMKVCTPLFTADFVTWLLAFHDARMC